jgi:hypothetical protein
MVELTADHTDPCGTSKLGLCVVAFLDGSVEAQEARAAQLKVLDDVRISPANKVSISLGYGYTACKLTNK